MLLMAMASGAVVMPEPVTKELTWFNAGDIPPDELSAGRNGSVYYKTIVKPSGRADVCIVEQSSLSNADKDRFCGTVMKRYQYHKVLGPDGMPAYFVQEKSFVYYQPDSKAGTPMHAGPDFSIDVRKLPKALEGGVEVRINVAVDTVGKLVRCDAPSDAAQPALAKLACGQLPSLWAAMPEKNSAGEPIAYVRQMRVEFREAGAPAG